MNTNSVVELVLDTLRIKKQALVFANSKTSAEKTAEEIAHALKKTEPINKELADRCLSALDKPTRQCERLAKCLEHNIAFHHAGLPAKQRAIVEEEFKKGTIKIIACTPTLAAGINMPSFRAIIKDLKRFGINGMSWIPNLEYQQMAGRCGRPDFHDTHGEAIIIASDEYVKKELHARYIIGTPEAIYSKLAVEPVFRTYVLALIAAHSFRTRRHLLSFFEKTFWAYQYGDTHQLRNNVNKVLEMLKEWNFIVGGVAGNFVSASELANEHYEATPIGKRVAELYLDPLTAHELLQGIHSAESKNATHFSFIHLISCALEMRPFLHAGTREIQKIEEQLALHDNELLTKADYDYDSFLDSTKTALLLHDWIDEYDEEALYEKYAARPGEIHAKLERADWLLFALEELSRLTNASPDKQIPMLRQRLKYGVKEELIPLLKFNGIGKARARILYTHNIRNVNGVKTAPFTMLSALIGKHVAASLKKQVGISVEEKTEKPSTLLQWSAK